MMGRLLRSRQARFVAALAVLLVLAVAFLALRSSSTDDSWDLPIDVGALSIEAPASVAAGEGFDIEVIGGDHGQLVDLTIDTGYGLSTFQALSRDGVAAFAVPADDGPASGVMLLTAKSIGRVADSTIEVVPGEAMSPVDLYLGPRTVVADNEDFSMLVAVPTDALGNPVADGTLVSTRVTRPTLETEVLETTTAGLLAYNTLESRTTAGRTRLGVEVGDATAPERSFVEVAGVPETFSLELIDPLLPADGHALMRIRTTELQDRFTNALPDGTVVVLDTSGASGTRRLRSVTIDSIAEFVFEVPDQPGEVRFVATASGRISEPLTLTFAAAIDAVPVEVTSHPDGSLVTIGRVVTSRESFVADGTVALVSTTSGEWLLPLELGTGSVVVPETSGMVDVSVLGVSTSVDLGGRP